MILKKAKKTKVKSKKQSNKVKLKISSIVINGSIQWNCLELQYTIN